jgi:hypothetical protein
MAGVVRAFLCRAIIRQGSRLYCCGDAKIVYQLSHDLSGHEQRVSLWGNAIIRDATHKQRSITKTKFR